MTLSNFSGLNESLKIDLEISFATVENITFNTTPNSLFRFHENYLDVCVMSILHTLPFQILGCGEHMVSVYSVGPQNKTGHPAGRRFPC